MPRRKGVQPLQKLCLENVAGNMNHVWLRDYTEHYLDEYHFRYIMGPFSELAGSLIQQLLQLMGQSRRLTRPMLHLLLVPHLTELSLSTCPKLVTQAIAQIITVRCKNLSLLDLRGCSRIPTDALVDLIEGLPCLTKLNLSGTQCNTQVLSAVGSCCRRLRELDVSGCSRLSADSLLHLAYDPTVGSFCCPALQVLAVCELEPSMRSQDLLWALAFLLLALPSLTSLANALVTEAVCLVHSQELAGVKIPPGFPSLEALVQRRASSPEGEGGCARQTLPLRQMLHVSESSLATVCAACPHVAKATVLLEESPAVDSGVLLSWHHLTHLTLNCLGSRPLGELLPLTACLGPQLQSLSLGGFSVGDWLALPTLVGHCFNLRAFSASFSAPGLRGVGWDREPGDEGADLGEAFSLPPHTFPQLSAFKLDFAQLDPPVLPPDAAALRASLLSLLKHSPRLKSLELISLLFPLDGLFEKVLEAPGTALAHLSKLSLAQSKVSSQTVHLLLSSENQLSHLNLEECPDIGLRDYSKLLRRVSREGLDLLIVWR
ncbi:uncharacterized protein LOC133363944 isoform X2 [Rhineura floridana]|nr:uncharacterized protein LOC133363944 isoform X2 [Rhineura floridana]XP_061439713.1 uncharacterized protein LOC133363944 isoform X2 [Rhineura floridana]